MRKSLTIFNILLFALFTNLFFKESIQKNIENSNNQENFLYLQEEKEEKTNIEDIKIDEIKINPQKNLKTIMEDTFFLEWDTHQIPEHSHLQFAIIIQR